MKRLRIVNRISVLSALGLVLVFTGCNDTRNPAPVNEETTSAAVAALKARAPTAKTVLVKGQLKQAYGAPLATGTTADESTEAFRQRHATAFGVLPEELVRVTQGSASKQPQDPGLGLMFDKTTGQYKYKLYRYQQTADGLPVHQGEVRTLVRQGGDNPVIWAHSATKRVSKRSFARPAKPRAPELPKALAAVVRAWPATGRLDLPPTSLSLQGDVEQTVYAGTDENVVDPVVASRFVVTSSAPQSSWTVVTDSESGNVLSIENNDYLEDVVGTVRGMVTSGSRAMDCGEEVSTVLPYAEVTSTGLGPVYTSVNGAYTLVNPGTASIDVVSPVGGLYFDVSDYAGANEKLTQSVLPPGPLEFLHNPANASDALRAQANAYVKANEVRDLVLSYIPNYPTISTQKNFQISVNRTDSYCPGNAWYSSATPSLNFCVSSSSYANTAFGNVVQHEFGHHVVNSGGSGQGAYGEGMSDTIAMLVSDEPGLGYGFYLNSCSTPLRNADNECQYSATSCSSCGSAIHTCGQLISGIAWDIRNALLAVDPTNYRQILTSLFLNSVPMHTGTAIDGSIAIDLLTLDDDDGNIDNGTPHYAQICAGFAAHGLSCPEIATGLDVVQPTDTSIEGPLGGPFTPQTAVYTLSNLGPDTTLGYDVQLVAPTPWLTISNPTGEIGLNQSAAVTVSIEPDVASTLPNGTYTAQLNFVNTTTGVGNESHTITLQVGTPVYVFSEDFSSGMGGFTLDSTTGNPWHRSTSCADSATGHSTPGSLYFGSDSSCNFALGSVSGTVTSHEISISDPSQAELTFNYYLATENSSYYDKAQVLVSVNGGAYVIVASNNAGGVDLADGTTGSWQAATVDLSTLLAGLSSPNIRLRFSFNSVDSIGNTYTGFVVDDVKISALPNTCLTHSECDDGLTCNGAEQCVSGSCVAGTAVICDDGIACTVDSCSDAQGGCIGTPNHAVCSDGLACNGAEVCSASSGCAAGPPLNCDDGSVCTTDSCSDSAGCQHTAINCDDGSACTTDSCNAATGCANVAVTCNDSNECTTDSCNPSSGCSYATATDGTACTDDRNACTSDACSVGICTHASNGTCSLNPCAAYCSNPVTFSGNYQSGNLGMAATCHETTGTINGGNCGNFVTERTLYVNGTAMSCNNGNWSSLPAKANGGYCVQTTAGNHPWAYFVTW